MFTFFFDISTDSNKFLTFIKDVRKNVCDANNPILVAGIARLTAMVENPETFDMSLRNSRDNVVTLRVRTDNLYVIGFSNTAGNWFEFSHDNNRARMIEGSTLLSYNGSYTNNGINSLNEGEAILGRPAVTDAINRLASFSGTSDDNTRARLRALIVNFIESTRFDTIADRVDVQMSNPSEASEKRRLTTENISLIRGWGKLSQALRNQVNNPEGSNPFSGFSEMGIHDITEAMAALGMVLIGMTVSSRQRRPSGSGTSRSMKQGVSSTTVKETDSVGLTLAEVVGVQLVNIDGKVSGDLYGTISITDGFNTVEMFNRDENNTQWTGRWEFVELTWPDRPIFGADDFIIDVNLMDHGDEVARGQVAWNSRDTLSREYDQIHRRRVGGKSGVVDVCFSVLTDAVIANVDVVLMDANCQRDAKIHGNITVSTVMAFCGDQINYAFFRKERDQYINVQLRSRMELERRMISAARCSVLKVSANLLLKPDDEQIADGSVAFKPRLYGHDYKEIDGYQGRVRVYVTWSL